jgi:hypothetical protein
MSIYALIRHLYTCSVGWFLKTTDWNKTLIIFVFYFFRLVNKSKNK